MMIRKKKTEIKTNDQPSKCGARRRPSGCWSFPTLPKLLWLASITCVRKEEQKDEERMVNWMENVMDKNDYLTFSRI